MSRISQKATEVIVRRPSVCFHHLTDTVASLDDVDKDWLIQMLKQFKIFGGINWDDISKVKGLGWDRVPGKNMKYTIPKSIGKNELYHLYITRKSRVWGYRDGDAFQLVWLDPEHKVTPE